MAKKHQLINGKEEEFIDWLDTEGNIINAGDGGIIYAGGVYHWYGQVMRDLCERKSVDNSAATIAGIAMYRSMDLVNWDYEGIVLSCGTNMEGDLQAPLRFERSKILYNNKTGKYVLWCHYVKYPGIHGDTVGTAEAGVAVSDSVNGPYRWIGSSRPIDSSGLVKDCTVFQDDDGSAYFVYDRRKSDSLTDRCLHIVKLSDDYLSFGNTWKRIDPAYRREAPVMLKKDGYYYLITSGVSGWTANQSRYYRSKNLMGPWEDLGDPCIGDTSHTTFHSQGTYGFVNRSTGQHIFMAERHNTDSFLHCSYVWLPIEFHEDHTLSISYRNIWDL